MIKKVLGLALIIIGLAVIFYGLYSSFNVFTGKVSAPEIFKITSATESVGSQDIQAQLQNMVAEQLKGMLPVGSITTLFNLISWSIFAGILVFGGAQISGLGIKLFN
ncbi:MAG: hypothetical protein PHW33_03605 [Candidatus Portnoybacteria bacterium]|nr:hypothetical protein [Candidatus Portnoybacteria bacterium]